MLDANQVHAYLSLLQATDFVGVKPIRIGSYADGGYVMLDHALDQVDALYAYGIGSNIDFETEFCYRYHCDAHLYDHTIQNLPDKLPQHCFHQEGVADKPGLSLNTLAHHITHNGDQGKNLILKMDVEGAEYTALLATPDATLKQFSQIVIECHDMHQIQSPENYSIKYNVLKKLHQHFYVYHAHPNNHDDTHVLFGYMIPQTLELTFINRSLNLTPQALTEASFPRSLDAPCKLNRPESLLSYWPFNQADRISIHNISCRYLHLHYLHGRAIRKLHKRRLQKWRHIMKQQVSD